MAEIRPFRALQYDAARVPIRAVVTQPYDKITPAMRERYLSAHPNNLVRLLRPLDNSGVGTEMSCYEDAARTWDEWRREGIIQRIDQPAIFPYYQRFALPGSGELRTRKGFVALVRLEDYGNGVVFPHERTLSAPRQDRLDLLRHTRTHFGQVFLMYSDPALRVDALIDAAIPSKPALSLCDEYEVEHMLWATTSGDVIEAVRTEMSNKKLLIADGHHRYETALAFRDEERKGSNRGDAGGFEWLMVTLVNMDSDGVVILPTHRVLSGLANFEPAVFLERVRQTFEMERVADSAALIRMLPERGRSGPSIGLVLGQGQNYLLQLGPKSRSEPESASRLASLDVVLLHRLLEHCLGLTEEVVRKESHLRYLRDPSEAIAVVESHQAQACFLLNPTPMADIREISFGGGVLPQKSTDFFPKLLSGLVMYSES